MKERTSCREERNECVCVPCAIAIEAFVCRNFYYFQFNSECECTRAICTQTQSRVDSLHNENNWKCLVVCVAISVSHFRIFASSVNQTKRFFIPL